MLPILTSATPDMAPTASALIYLSMGKMANLIQTIEIESLRKLIGYSGFHRMVKDLS
jgi:hypothetical protein